MWSGTGEPTGTVGSWLPTHTAMRRAPVRPLDHRTTRALQIALAANAAFLVVQLLAGIAFDSLALIADSAHMGADVGALALALVARRLASRPASTRNTYGMLRAEVLAAQANALALVLVSGWVIFEAVQRLSDPPAVDGLGVLVVGFLGLAVNAGSAWLIARSGDRSLNVRGAFLHLAADAAGSLGVIVAGAVVLATGEDWIDPAISLLITALVLVAAFGLLRDATVVLLEGVPKGIDVKHDRGEPPRVRRRRRGAPPARVGDRLRDAGAVRARGAVRGADVARRAAERRCAQGDARRAVRHRALHVGARVPRLRRRRPRRAHDRGPQHFGTAGRAAPAGSKPPTDAAMSVLARALGADLLDADERACAAPRSSRLRARPRAARTRRAPRCGSERRSRPRACRARRARSSAAGSSPAPRAR